MHSQSNIGKFLLGGNFNLDLSGNKRTFKSGTYSNEMEKITSIEFSSFFGYFAFKNLSPGIKLDYQYFRQLAPDGSGSYNRNSSNSILFIPSIRYYFLNTNCKPFVQAGYGIGLEKLYQDYYQNIVERKNILSQWEVWAGISIFIKSNVSFEIGLGYSSLTEYFKDKMEDGTYNKWQNVINGTESSIGIVLFL
jgi:hypothetical protein